MRFGVKHAFAIPLAHNSEFMRIERQSRSRLRGFPARLPGIFFIHQYQPYFAQLELLFDPSFNEARKPEDVSLSRFLLEFRHQSLYAVHLQLRRLSQAASQHALQRLDENHQHEQED